MPEESLTANIWDLRKLGVGLPKNVLTVKNSDVDYICDHYYPFLQLVNSNAIFTEDTSIKFIPSSAGWIIHDYGEAISASAPHDPKAKVYHSSSVIGQITTASEIANLISTKNWEEAELIAGTLMMQRFMWIASKQYGFELKGYTPTPGDEKRLDRLLKQGMIIEKLAGPKLESSMVGAA